MMTTNERKKLRELLIALSLAVVAAWLVCAFTSSSLTWMIP